MKIGQKINEFDRTTGTVEEFNRLFPQNPIKDRRGILEVGEIVGLGQETRRHMKLFSSDMESNEIVDEFEWEFGKVTEELTTEKDVKKVPPKERGFAKFKYIARNSSGEVIGTSTSITGLAKEIGASKSVVGARVHADAKSKTKYDFTVEREVR